MPTDSVMFRRHPNQSPSIGQNFELVISERSYVFAPTWFTDRKSL